MEKIIKVGDLVTTYHKGIHLVSEVSGKTVTYKTVLLSNLKRINAIVEKSCHIDHCTLVDEAFIVRRRKEMDKEIREIEELIEFYN